MNDQAVAEVASVEPEFDLSDFMTDPVKENDGVWFPIGSKREVKIARAGNENYKRLVRAKYRQNRTLIEQDDDAAADLNDEIMIEVTAQTILRGLRSNGVEVPYTPSKGVEMLKVGDFFKKVTALSQGIDAYKLKGEDAAVKS